MDEMESYVARQLSRQLAPGETMSSNGEMPPAVTEPTTEGEDLEAAFRADMTADDIAAVEAGDTSEAELFAEWDAGRLSAAATAEAGQPVAESDDDQAGGEDAATMRAYAAEWSARADEAEMAAAST